MKNNNIAVYYDFENIHATLHDRRDIPESQRYHRTRYTSQEAIVDVSAITDMLRKTGTIVMNKAYANWAFMSQYRESLNLAGMQLIQLFPRGWNAKNGADINLALDVMNDLQQMPHIDTVVIVSNDTDFISLAQNVARLGKRIVAIGLADANRFWKANVHQFYDYELIVSPVNVEAVMRKCMQDLTLTKGPQLIMRTQLSAAMLAMDERTAFKNHGFDKFSSMLERFPHIVELVGDQYVQAPAVAEAENEEEVPAV